MVEFASDDSKQEDQDEEKAAKICYVNNGVTFNMLGPSSLCGNDANPVFRELAIQTVAPSWNFNNYVLDRDGEVVQRFDRNTTPESAELRQAIKKIL